MLFSLNKNQFITSFALGITQLISFGTSLYLLTILGVYIAHDLHITMPQVSFGMTFGVLCGAFISPHIGRLVNHGYGRRVLCVASFGFATGLIIIALSNSLYIYIIGWGIMGMAMASGLHDVVFSQLGLINGRDARPMISAIALIGGFASSVFWLIGGNLLNNDFIVNINWRQVCFIYALLHILINIPIYLFILPKANKPKINDDLNQSLQKYKLPSDVRIKLWLISILFMCETLVASIIGVHIVNILTSQDVNMKNAIIFAAFIGPAQVLGRFIEISFCHKVNPINIVGAALLLIIIGMLLIGFFPHNSIYGIIIYGGGIGVLSIARGTLPLEMFDKDIYPILMGKMARPIAFTQAAAPTIGAIIIGMFNPLVALLVLCCIVGISFVVSLTLRKYAIFEKSVVI